MQALTDDEIPSIVQEESGRSSASWIERRTRSIRRPRIRIACSYTCLHTTFGAAAPQPSRLARCVQMLWIDDDQAAARSLEDVAIAPDGKPRIEGTAQPWPRRRIPRDGREPLDASAREDRAELRRATPRISFRQQACDPECAPVRLAVGECCTRHLDRAPTFRKDGRGAEKREASGAYPPGAVKPARAETPARTRGPRGGAPPLLEGCRG
jgi:hypothetical protein